MTFALGSLGWTEYEYYNTSFKGFILAQRGYDEERKLQQHYLRRVAYIIHCSMVEKPLNPSTLWPIGEEMEDVKSDDQEREERHERLRQDYLRRAEQRNSQGG